MTTVRLTSIIIPTYNGLPLLQRSLSAIETYTDRGVTPYEVIIVDDGSQDGTAQWCQERGLRLICLPRNRGFPVACNKGMRLASGSHLLLLNNDVTVTTNWLTNLHKALASDEAIGMVGPVSNYVSGRQQVECHYNSMEQFQQLAAGANRSDPRQWEETPRLVGLCLLFSRSFYEHVGELDEQYSPGHFEDDDWSFRARQLGYRLLFCRDVLVHHEGSASFKRQDQEQVQQLLQRNRDYFMRKWRTDPHSFI